MICKKITIYYLCILFTLFFTMPIYTVSIAEIMIKKDIGLDYGLVAYYPFNGNANDESENTNHGTINGATLVPDKYDNSNSAYSFLDENKIIIPHNDSLNTDYSFSLSAWIKPERFRSNSSHFIISKWWSSNSGGDFIFFVKNINDKALLALTIADKNASLVDSVETPDNQLIALDKWTYVAATYNRGFIKLYINNELIVEKESNIKNTQLSEYSNDDIVIGNAWSNEWYNYVFDGVIDEVRIYNRVLSNQEINSLYLSSSILQNSKILYTYNAKQLPSEDGWAIINYNNYESKGATIENEVLHIKDSQTYDESAIHYLKEWDVKPDCNNIAEFDLKIVSNSDDIFAIYIGISNGTNNMTYDLRTNKIVSYYNNAQGHHVQGKTVEVDTTDYNTYKLSIIDGIAKLFINNNLLIEQTSGIGNYNGNGVEFGAGSSPGAGEAYFKEIRIYRECEEHTNNIHDGLVAYYRFEGNANDSSGNGNDLEIKGPVQTEDRFGYQTAYYFDGENDYLGIKTNYFKNQPFTVKAWIKTNDEGAIIGYENNNDYYGWEMGIYKDLELPAFFSLSNNDGTYLAKVYSDIKVADNEWHQLVGVDDGDNLTIYVDGEKKGTSNSEQAVWDKDMYLYIGAFRPLSNKSLHHWFKGSIDDISLYNKALSDDDVRILYTSESYNLSIEPNQYDFNQVNVGSTLSKNIKFSNKGNFNILISRVFLDSNTEFIISNDTCTGVLLSSLDSCDVEVSFLPDTKGLKESNLNLIVKNLFDYNAFKIPISGMGNIALKADFEADYTCVNIGQPVNFTNLSKGTVKINSWDFDGDGKFDSFKKDPSYIYETPGLYTVSLKVYQPYKDKAIKRHHIKVGFKETKPGGGDWGDPSNWIGGVIPDITDGIIISGVVTISTLITCKHLILTSGAILKGLSNSALKIFGNFISHGAIEGVQGIEIHGDGDIIINELHDDPKINISFYPFQERLISLSDINVTDVEIIGDKPCFKLLEADFGSSVKDITIKFDQPKSQVSNAELKFIFDDNTEVHTTLIGEPDDDAVSINYPLLKLSNFYITEGNILKITGEDFSPGGNVTLSISTKSNVFLHEELSADSKGNIIYNFNTNTDSYKNNQSKFSFQPYYCWAIDDTTSLSTDKKKFIVKIENIYEKFELIHPPMEGSSESFSTNGVIDVEWTDVMNISPVYSDHPTRKSQRSYKYSIELSTDAGNNWENIGIVEGYGTKKEIVTETFSFKSSEVSDNCQIKIIDLYQSSRNIKSIIFSNHPPTSIHLSTKKLWDYSYPTRKENPKGVAADGVARIYLKLTVNNIAPSISNIKVSLSDGHNQSPMTLGKLMTATVINDYSEEANVDDLNYYIDYEPVNKKSMFFYYDKGVDYNGDYYENIDDSLSGYALKDKLHRLIKGHTEFAYDSLWEILKETDEDESNTDNIILFYSQESFNKDHKKILIDGELYDWDHSWNKEHIWPTSHGNFGTTKGVGTDLHHIRAVDRTINISRQDKDFDSNNEDNAWEPELDNIKGDIARMLFYVHTRYEGDSDEPDLELTDDIPTSTGLQKTIGKLGKLSTLLKWHREDPVDEGECIRNQKIYENQNNRNPFIDHPEYVDIFHSHKEYSYKWENDINLSKDMKKCYELISEWSEEKDKEYYKEIDDNNLSQELLYETVKKNHVVFSYKSLDEKLENIDEDPDNNNNIILFYSQRSQNKKYRDSGASWEREHVWSKSHGNFGTNKGMGTDLHHIRPVKPSLNKSKGNKDFNSNDENAWEPPSSNIKGDIARMLFYMDVRYEGTDGELDLEMFEEIPSAGNKEPRYGKLSTLLKWHKDDPVDDRERKRNNIIYEYQNNRNPFIDHPGFVDKIWGNRNYYFWYVAPDNFVGNNPQDKNSKIREIKVTFDVLFSNNLEDTIDDDIKIVRPPLMLVHGLGGDRLKTWKDFNIADRFMLIHRINIGPHDAFYQNAELISSQLGKKCKLYRNKYKYASNQIDYICHSMGGNVLRKVLTDFEAKYYCIDNYKKGYVNKFITLNTPHLGSPLANVISDVVEKLNNKLYLVETVSQLCFYNGDFTNFISHLIEPGRLYINLLGVVKTETFRITQAVQDLQINNSMKFDEVNIPSHLIVGDFIPGEFSLPDIPDSVAVSFEKINDFLDFFDSMIDTYIALEDKYSQRYYELNNIKYNKNINKRKLKITKKFIRVFQFIEFILKGYQVTDFAINSDLIVPVDSQLSNLSRDTNNVSVFDWVGHALVNSVTANHKVIGKVNELLNMPSKSEAFGSIPARTTSKKFIKKYQQNEVLRDVKNIADADDIKIISPTVDSNFYVDDKISVSFKVNNIEDLVYVVFYFQGESYSDFSLSHYYNFDFQITGKRIGTQDIFIRAIYSRDDSSEILHKNITVNVLPNSQPISFSVSPFILETKVGQRVYPSYETVYQNFINNDIPTNVKANIDDESIVSFDNNYKFFRGLNPGETFAVLSIEDLSYTMYISVEEGTPGDIDNDLKVSLKDVLIALQVTSGLNMYNITLSDINGNRKIDNSEVIYTMEILAGIR